MSYVPIEEVPLTEQHHLNFQVSKFTVNVSDAYGRSGKRMTFTAVCPSCGQRKPCFRIKDQYYISTNFGGGCDLVLEGYTCIEVPTQQIWNARETNIPKESKHAQHT